MPILLGAVADDFTGATDLCNTLVKGGMRTVQAIGAPPAGLDLPQADAVVVALKSRTCPPEEAVAASVVADAAQESLRTGVPVQVPALEDLLPAGAAPSPS